MTRGAADVYWCENIRDMDYFNKYDQNKDYDDLILKNLIVNPPEDYQFLLDKFLNFYVQKFIYFYNISLQSFIKISMINIG